MRYHEWARDWTEAAAELVPEDHWLIHPLEGRLSSESGQALIILHALRLVRPGLYPRNGRFFYQAASSPKSFTISRLETIPTASPFAPVTTR